MKSILLTLGLIACTQAASVVILDGDYGDIHVTVSTNERENGEFVYEYWIPGWDQATTPAATIVYTDSWFHLLNEEGLPIDGQIWNVEGAEQLYQGSGSFNMPLEARIYIRFDSEHAPSPGLFYYGVHGISDGQLVTFSEQSAGIRPAGWTASIPEPGVPLLAAIAGLLALRRRR